MQFLYNSSCWSSLSPSLSVCVSLSLSLSLSVSFCLYPSLSLSLICICVQGECRKELAGPASNLAALAGQIELEEENPVILIESGVR